MGAGASAVQHLGKKTSKRPAVLGVVTFTLGAGAVATLAAALASLLVESVLAKRVLWVVVAVAVAVGAGVWRAAYGATSSPPGSDRLPHDARTGSPE
ncbi:hypothetical protein F7R91_40825 [Streptomyces luteolifulvus]|jgi:hypothetical protein|uniref:Uncharacterized protein n=1 Tax=Streptomyces luteolifulvus TaxID=2615112 RepID=A0A6H9UNB8_9ACTN|nr:hypothetical protein F7R91_40825 [Streptomyces luteolifulvus]